MLVDIMVIFFDEVYVKWLFLSVDELLKVMLLIFVGEFFCS